MNVNVKTNIKKKRKAQYVVAGSSFTNAYGESGFRQILNTSNHFAF